MSAASRDCYTRPRGWMALVVVLVLGLQGEAARFAPLFTPQQARQALASASARLPTMAPRLDQSGPAKVVAAAALGATAARGYYAVRTGRESSSTSSSSPKSANTLAGLFARVGARSVLAARLVSDLAAAAVASMMVSPFISIVDRAIIQSASGTMGMQASVAQGLRVLATKPALFLARPDFICTFCLYGATYLAANAISTVAEEMSHSDAMPKFLGTTAINMPGSIAKDQALTKIFGVVGGAAKVPMASFALFTVRDVATMAAAFTLPTPMSAMVGTVEMQQDFGVDSGMADVTSQLVSPGLVQVFSTPVHILGLDLYNHPSSSCRARLRVVQDSFLPAIAMRVARIGVAFGVGGLGNTCIRKRLHGAISASAAAAGSAAGGSAAAPSWSQQSVKQKMTA